MFNTNTIEQVNRQDILKHSFHFLLCHEVMTHDVRCTFAVLKDVFHYVMINVCRFQYAFSPVGIPHTKTKRSCLP